MKIVVLCTDLGIPVLGTAGASVHIQSMVRAFANLGHDVTLIAPCLTRSAEAPRAPLPATILNWPSSFDGRSDQAVTARYLARLGLPPQDASTIQGKFESANVHYNEAVIRQLSQLVHDQRPEFLYERASLYGISGVVVAAALRIPLVLEVNDPLVLEERQYRNSNPSRVAEYAEHFAIRGADVVLPVSSALCEHVIKAGVPPHRAVVIPNGVDATVFHPASNGPSGRPSSPVRIGFAGGLRPWHDVMAIPRLFERLVRHVAHLQLVIVGDGPLRSRLEDDLAARGLRDKTDLRGDVSHATVAKILRSLDIALVPHAKLNHTFYFSPLKLFEYMASGVAVVAANIGQIGEVLQHEQTGLLYDPGDDNQLFEACLRLVECGELRRKLGRAAAEEAGKYSWEGNVAKVINLIGPFLGA